VAKSIRRLSACLAAGLLLAFASTVLADGGNGITVRQLAKTTHSWNGAELPAYGDGQPQVTILRIEIAPGAKLPRHAHPVINAGVLLRGELTVTTEAGDTFRLTAGHPIVEVVDTWHHSENTGHEPAEIIVFYAGEEGEPITVK
jgi:quercetin dioxygenase-like cupin family protein